MRVALYARVSTESQQARGTIGSQLAVLPAGTANTMTGSAVSAGTVTLLNTWQYTAATLVFVQMTSCTMAGAAETIWLASRALVPLVMATRVASLISCAP